MADTMKRRLLLLAIPCGVTDSIAPSLPPATVALSMDALPLANSGSLAATITNQGATITTTDPYQGAGAVVLDGVSNAIRLSAGAYTNSWTVGFWIKYEPNITPDANKRG
eukprot:2334267-Prymnesium_polylepis.1